MGRPSGPGRLKQSVCRWPQGAERARRSSELPFQCPHHSAEPLRGNALCRQAPQRFHGDQIAEVEESLAPTRARLQEPQAGPILKLLPRSAGHALHFTARELLLHSPDPWLSIDSQQG